MLMCFSLSGPQKNKWLSNQKPSLFPNKWENVILNLVFSNPNPRFPVCDPVTRFGIFNLFLDDVVIGYVVEMTDLNARRENIDDKFHH